MRRKWVMVITLTKLLKRRRVSYLWFCGLGRRKKGSKDFLCSGINKI